MAFETELHVGLFPPPPPAGVPALAGSIEPTQAPGIVKSNEDWEISVQWSVQGQYLVDHAAQIMPDSDKWLVHFYFEGMGPSAPELAFGPVVVEVGATHDLLDGNGNPVLDVNGNTVQELDRIEEDVEITQGSVNPGPPPVPAQDATIKKWIFNAKQKIGPTTNNQLAAGVYKVTAAITYQDAAGAPRAMAGFSDAEPVQVYPA